MINMKTHNRLNQTEAQMRWGILATGNIANKFAKTILQMNEAGETQELVACASRNKNKSEEFGQQYGLNSVKCYGSYEEMLADTDVEAVYVATPNNMHFKNCVMCLNAKKHVLCEKPFTTSAKEAEKLFQLAEEKGLFIMEGFWIRFLPCLIKMQEIISSGQIGEVIFARSDYGFIAKGARKDRKFNKDLAGGALLDIGIYNLGFMRMVMSDRNPADYTADYHINEYGTDDFSTITLRYNSSSENKQALAHITTCIGLDIPRNAAIFGTNGNIFINDFQHADKMTVCITGEEPKDYYFPIEMGGFEYEIREVEACVKSQKTTSDILKSSDTIAITALMENLLREWGV